MKRRITRQASVCGAGLHGVIRAGLPRGASCMAMCVLGILTSNGVLAQTWKPEKTVEIIVGTGAGGALDRATRTVQKLMQDKRLVPGSVVVNKPGGGHAIALNYLNQNPGDGHYLQVTSEPFLTNKITGRSQLTYTDFTPIARLFNEYMAFTVNAGSPILNGKDFANQLRKDAGALSVSVSTALGNANHIALALFAKSVGADPRRLKTVVFSSAGDALAAVAGNHIGMIVTGPANIIPMVQAGKVRILGVSAPKRMGGALADTPTMKEQGIDVEAGTWRIVVAPRGLTKAQIAYWDNVFRQLTGSSEWRSDLEKNLFSNTYADSAETRHFLNEQNERLSAVLTELGLAK